MLLRTTATPMTTTIMTDTMSPKEKNLFAMIMNDHPINERNPFASVSHVIQENVIPFFHYKQRHEYDKVPVLEDIHDDDVNERSPVRTKRRKPKKRHIDPTWDDLNTKARREAPRRAQRQTRRRQRKDAEILITNEEEIPKKEKLFLLTSRTLNDKCSLPGHIYRYLIQEYYDKFIDHLGEEEGDRSQVNNERPAEALKGGINTASSVGENCNSIPRSFSLLLPLLQEQQDDELRLTRRKRDGVHMIINQVTAALLESRPQLFASSAAIAEMSAIAVEELVFAKLNSLVFEDFINDTYDIDLDLTRKILEYESDRLKTYEEEADPQKQSHIDWSHFLVKNGISEPAIDALSKLSSAKSPIGKLQCCVNFLEILTNHFSRRVLQQEEMSSMPSTTTSNNESNVPDTDCLLKMVCEHVICAKVPHINAEILFIQEFARNEQTLRGREGYALVTMQASLYFLNNSASFHELY